VSRVFNHPSSVTSETRERVLGAARELNYHRNVLASNFVRGRTGNIGVILPDIPNVHIFSVYYFSELLSGIGAVLSREGFGLLLSFHKTETSRRNDYESYFTEGRVDGCILLGTLRNDPALLELKAKGYRFCLLNNYLKHSGISYADVDNVAGARALTSHLYQQGCRRIAFLNGPPAYTNSIDRMDGYKRALAEHGGEFRTDYVLEGNYGRKSGYAAAEQLVKLRPRPDAVFAANDRMAAGLIQGLHDQGWSVPRDIAVAGYDDSDISTVIIPALTTVRIPFFDLGRSCAERFIELLGGAREHFEIIIEPELIVRQSALRAERRPSRNRRRQPDKREHDGRPAGHAG
jgi:LacI family transcriptional regulator